MQWLRSGLSYYIRQLHITSPGWTDIVEIIIIAVLVYNIILWIRKTRAYSLLKGLVVIVIFIAVAALLNMTTILWIVRNVTGIAVTALVIILQPELRSAMEELGQKNFITALFSPVSPAEGRFSDKTIGELVRACTSMAAVKTGALIVIEQNTPLLEYEKTGIEVDGVLTSQLLINIFEKNTPLHDGAVIVRGDRVVSATCDLPLSQNRMDKDLGTRHRAAAGVSEVTDALTIVVSEETGSISIAYKGRLLRDIDANTLREQLVRMQDKQAATQKKSILNNLIGGGKR